MKAVQIVLNAHIECGRDGTFFLVSANVEIPVGAAVREAMHQPRIPVEAEDDVFVLCKKLIVASLGKAMRMLAAGLKLHQIDNIHHADL